MFARVLFGFAGLIALVFASATQPALAEAPQVHFDLVPLVAVHDVTTWDFAIANPQERMWEARVTLSSLLRKGQAADLVEYQLTFSSPERNLEFVDYSPRTTLATDVAGTIHQENTENTKQSAGLNVTGKYQTLLTATANLGGEQTNGASTKLDRLPPLDLVSAAGTYDLGRAVFFKLRPTPRTSLEGTREFSVTFRAPINWRADYLVIRCAATAIKRGLTRQFDEQTSAADTAFLVALHRAYDPGARQAGQRLTTAVEELRQSAGARRKEIEKASYANGLQQFAGGERKIPADWMSQVVYGAVGRDSGPYMRRLPSDVVAAAAELTTAKLELHRLCGR